MSININSPTLQAMLGDIPKGVGNFPTFNGNGPTVYTDNRTSFSSPYPSPKDMMINGSLYVGNPFTSPNNPLSGYNNPYMGINRGSNTSNINYNDPDFRDIYEAAMKNGVSIEEQIQMNEYMTRQMMRLVCADESEVEKIMTIISNSRNHNSSETVKENKRFRSLKVRVIVDDVVVSEKTSAEYNNYDAMYEQNRLRQFLIEADKEDRKRDMFWQYIRNNKSINIKPSNNGNIIDFYNENIYSLYNHYMDILNISQKMSMASSMYNRNAFSNLLHGNHASLNSDKQNGIRRFVGRNPIYGDYGIMPDGRPTTPGLDPSVAASFSYDPSTGQYSVTAPTFMKNSINERIANARNRFISQINMD